MCVVLDGIRRLMLPADHLVFHVGGGVLRGLPCVRRSLLGRIKVRLVARHFLKRFEEWSKPKNNTALYFFPEGKSE